MGDRDFSLTQPPAASPNPLSDQGRLGKSKGDEASVPAKACHIAKESLANSQEASTGSPPSSLKERAITQRTGEGEANIAQEIMGIAPKAQSTSIAPPRPFTDEELGRLEELINENEMFFTSENVLESYAAIQRESNFSFPDMFQWLSRIEEIPQHLRDSLSQIAMAPIANEIGHEWGIKGNLGESSLLGTTPGYMPAMIAMRLKEYLASRSDKNSPHTLLSSNDWEQLERGVKEASVYDLTPRSNWGNLKKMGEFEKSKEIIKTFKANHLVVIPASWSGHAINLTLFQDCRGNNYLAYCNRGEKPRGEALTEDHPDIKIHLITKELTANHIFEMIKESEGFLDEGSRQARMQFFEGTGQGSMEQLLGLQMITTVRKKTQKVSNCGLANMKAGFHAAILFLLMDKELRNNTAMTPKMAIEESKQNTLKVYKDVTSSSRSTKLEQFLALQEMIDFKALQITDKQVFSVMAQIGAKVADRASFNPNALETRDLEKRLTDFAYNSSMPLSSCLCDGTINSAEFRKDILERVNRPGVFIIDKKDDGQFVLAYTTQEGKVVEENVDHTKTLGDLCRSKELSYPIVIKPERLIFPGGFDAEKALANKPAGSYVFAIKANREGYDCVVMMPDRKAYTLPTFDPDHKGLFLPPIQEDILLIQGKYIKLDADSEKEFKNSLQQDLKEGHYVVVETIDQGQRHLKLFMKQDDALKEVQLDPAKFIFPQIENLLRKSPQGSF